MSTLSQIVCRPVTAEDEPFLRHLIIATLAEELAAWAWPEAIRDQLLEMQYRIRRQGIDANYPGSDRSVIFTEGQPVGWIVVTWSAKDVHIVEIAVLPEQRGKGIGTRVLGDVITEAVHRGIPARLQVNVTNRAIGLYGRLGFVRTGGDEVQHFLERVPD
jgi:ribosomal protein S18 acetylase RimI-like enzyme